MKSKRETAVILLLITFIALFSGCGQVDNKPVENKSSAIIVSGTPITLRVWVPYILQAYVKSNYIMESNSELEKKTGVKIVWIEPPADQTAEAYNLMLASLNLPDLIEDINGSQTNNYSYPGGCDKAIEDGVILRLNDLIDKYAPNYKKIINSDQTVKKLTITDNGNIFGIAEIHADLKNLDDPIKPEPAAPGNGLVIRKDWLDELGLENPVTIDDWYTVLKAFKYEKNAIAPMLIDKTGIGINSQFLTAFGTAYTNRNGQEFYQENGKVKFGPIEPGFKQYLELMYKWYEEGLIDKSFSVRNTDLDTFSTNYLPTDKAGASNLGYGWVGDYLYKIAKTAKNPKFYLQAVNPPVLKVGDKIHFRYTTWSVGGFTAITTACKSPEVAMRWLDYQYSKEGILLNNWGREGVTYTLKDGKPVFTDLILKDPDPFHAGLIHTKLNGLSTPGVTDQEWTNALSSQAQIDVCKYWGTVDNSWVLPPLYRSKDEELTYASIMNEIKAYVNEMTVKFIIGIEPVSNYDVFVERIRNMGIEQVLKVQQDALNRYNNR